jgi:hypothetical protein
MGALRYVYKAETRNTIVSALEVARAGLRYASQSAYDRNLYALGARFDAEAKIVDTALHALDDAEAGAA